MNPNLSSYDLETKAADQRRRLDCSLNELKERVKERLDIKRNVQDFARQHVRESTGIVALFGLLLGYTTCGLFTRH